MEEIKICTVCGRKFSHRNRKYCCAECSKKGYLMSQTKRNKARERRLKEERAKRMGFPKRESPLQEKARKAREAGMTYRQYVAMEYARIRRD